MDTTPSKPREATPETPAAGGTLQRLPLAVWRFVRPWSGLIARLILGAVFIVAGLLKVDDLAQSGRAVNAYDVTPVELGRFIGAVLPFVEIAIGVLLVVGLATRAVAFINGLMYLVYIVGIAQAWARGLSIDCGCFSEGGQVAAEQTKYAIEIFRDVLLLALTAFLVVFPRTKYSLDACLAGPEENE